METLPTEVVVALWSLLGLLIGSFLNVVIHRIPIMMDAQSKTECELFLHPDKEPVSQPVFNLLTPASTCPHCGHAIRWYENIPLLSYAWLGGKCSQCKRPISPRYPAIELITALLFGWCAAQHGYSLSTVAWSGFCAALVCLAMIDWDTTFLPDVINQPLLWAGLIAANMHWIDTSWSQSFWGAVVGYLSLWSIYWLFKLLTGKEGMGYGDFKLLAALGAWFGLTALLPIILMASIVGAIVGIALKFNSALRPGGYIPFGPFLAGGALVCLLWGPQTLFQLVTGS